VSPAKENREQLFATVRTRLESLRKIFSIESGAERYSALFEEFLMQCEFGLALETICEFLLEPDVRPATDAELKEIASLHAAMEVDDLCVSNLKAKRLEQAKQLGVDAEVSSTETMPVVIPTAPAGKSFSGVPSALRYKLIAILGPEHVHPAVPSDEILGVQPKLVVLPGSESELAEILRLANEAGLAVIPRGGGTKISWGNPPSRADLILSTARLNNVLEHASSDLTVIVEAGCTIQKLQETLAEHGQRLAIDPLWPEKATVGGILSANDSGALRLRFGSLRDLIIGVTIALPDGTLASSGGKVVKNVAGYDLPKLVTGALGTLGIITRAVFRLHPLPHNTRSFSIATTQPTAARDLVLAIQDSKLAHTALQSRFSDEALPTSDILFEGTEVGLDAQAANLRHLCQPAEISDAPATVWNARQELWSISDPAETAIAKISTLPADLARVIELFHHAADSYSVRWKALIYATGLGWFRLEGPAENLRHALTNLRSDLEKRSGSLVVLQRPSKLFALDAWGTPGDSLPLMKAVKHRLDPANTLNPARFLAGI
jgi:glycolate oxidase FAD binding subunit